MMKRLWTIASAVVVIAVGATRLATPAQAATANFKCTDEQIEIIIEISDFLCDGGAWHSWGTCNADGSIDGQTECL
jgi:hypothetical protein